MGRLLFCLGQKTNVPMYFEIFLFKLAQKLIFKQQKHIRNKTNISFVVI